MGLTWSEGPTLAHFYTLVALPFSLASLAMVAAGRLLGYAEDHMNAWDYLAGQLLVAEAGGRVEDQDAEAAITAGGPVIVATPVIWDDLLAMCEEAF